MQRLDRRSADRDLSLHLLETRILLSGGTPDQLNEDLQTALGNQAEVDTLVGGVEREIFDAFGLGLPFVGTALASQSGTLDSVATALGTAFDAPIPDEASLRQAIFNELGPGGLGIIPSIPDANALNVELTNLDGDAMTAEEVVIDLPVSSALFSSSIGVEFDLGLPVLLSLDTSADINVDADYEVDLRIGANLDGLFIEIGSNNDARVTLNVNATTIDARGTLGFLTIDIVDGTAEGNTGLNNFQIALDIQGMQNRVSADDIEQLSSAPTVSGTAEVHVRATLTFAGSAMFPSVGADLDIEWSFAGNPLTGDLATLGNAPTIAFNNVGFGLGSLLGDFIRPILRGINQAIDPVRPVLDVLNTRVPVLSDVPFLVSRFDGALIPDGEVSLLEVAAELTGEPALYVLQVITELSVLLENAPLGDENGIDIILGSFDISGDVRSMGNISEATIGSSVIEDFAGQLGGAADTVLDFFDDLELPGFEEQGVAGLAFPIWEDPFQIFNMLLGQEANFFTFALPELDYGFEFDEFFSLLGPLGVRLRGGLSIEAGLAFGYDTRGLSSLVDGSGLGLADGFFISDTRNPDGTGEDIPEIQISASIEAFAELNAVVASAGVGGGISANVSLDLVDQEEIDTGTSDGKIRLGEILNPPNGSFGCIFEFTGTLEASLDAYVRVGITIFGEFVGWEKNFSIASATLLDFTFGCTAEDEVPPRLARVEGDGLLILNIGPDAGMRTVEPAIQDETYYISRGSQPDEIAVEAFGTIEYFTGVNFIQGDAGNGNDTIVVDELIDLDTNFALGDDDDEIRIEGTGYAVINGGGGDDVITLGPGGGDVFGGDGNDDIYGSPAMDIIDGGNDNDSIFGFDNDDLLLGGHGRDYIQGGAGNDLIDGGDGDDTLEGDDDDDQMIIGEDQIFGGAGNDILLGGLGADILDGQEGNDTLIGDRIVIEVTDFEIINDCAPDCPPPYDVLFYGQTVETIVPFYSDTIMGGSNNDLIYGMGGNDMIDPGSDMNTIIWEVGHHDDTVQGFGFNRLRMLGSRDNDSFELNTLGALDWRVLGTGGSVTAIDNPNSNWTLEIQGREGRDSARVNDVPARMRQIEINTLEEDEFDNRTDIIELRSEDFVDQMFDVQVVAPATIGLGGNAEEFGPTLPGSFRPTSGVPHRAITEHKRSQLAAELYNIYVGSVTDSVTLETNLFNDTINVLSVGGPTDIRTGDGNDTFNVLPTSAGFLSGQLDVDLGRGSNTFLLDTDNVPGSHTLTVEAGRLSGPTLGAGIEFRATTGAFLAFDVLTGDGHDTVTVSLGNTQGLSGLPDAYSIGLRNGVDTTLFTNHQPGQNVEIRGGLGNDTFIIDAANVQHAGEGTTIDGRGGIDSIIVTAGSGPVISPLGIPNGILQVFGASPIDYFSIENLDFDWIADAGGPYDVIESRPLELQSLSEAPFPGAFTTGWDLDGDLIADVFGESVTLSGADYDTYDLRFGANTITMIQTSPTRINTDTVTLNRYYGLSVPEIATVHQGEIANINGFVDTPFDPTTLTLWSTVVGSGLYPNMLSQTPFSPQFLGSGLTDELSGDLTVELWIRRDASLGTGTIFSVRRGLGGFDLEINATGNWQLSSDPMSAPLEGPTAPIGTWTHVAVVWNETGSDGTATLYINGSTIGSNNGFAINKSGEFLLGGASADYDEVRVWNEARTPAAIAETMMTELDPAMHVRLGGYFPFPDTLPAEIGGETAIPNLGNASWQIQPISPGTRVFNIQVSRAPLNPVVVDVAANGAFTLNPTFPVADTYEVGLILFLPNDAPVTRVIEVTVTDEPVLTNVMINQGEHQRSNLFQIDLTFNASNLNLDELISNEFISEVFFLRPLDGQPVPELTAENYSWNALRRTLTIDLTVDGFGGSDESAVADGRYELQISTERVLDADGDFLIDDDGTNDGVLTIQGSRPGRGEDLFQLDGDLNGDGEVNSLDIFLVIIFFDLFDQDEEPEIGTSTPTVPDGLITPFFGNGPLP